MSPDVGQPAAIPPGAIVVHVGPYKTGSTAAQASFAAARDAMTAQGLSYPGSSRRHAEEGWSVMQWAPRMRQVPPPEVWEEFVAQIHRAPATTRTLISTEDFGGCGAERIARIVSTLGAERVHMVTVVRPLDLLLPSQWQEQMKSMQSVSFEEWLAGVLPGRASKWGRGFWNSHDVGAQLDRWRAHLPPERIHAIVVPRADRTHILRSFEGLLGLTTDTLQPQAVDNASLSPAGTELLRRLNAVYAERAWSPDVYRELIRYGAVGAMMSASPDPEDAGKLELPAAHVAQVRALSVQRRDAVADSGINVWGDPDELLVPDGAVGAHQARTPDRLSADLAAAAVRGVVRGHWRVKRRLRAARRHQTPPTPDLQTQLSQTSTRALARELVGRALRRAPKGRG